MSLFTGSQALLEREAFVLFGALLRGGGQGQLIERFGVEARLLGELSAVALILHLPGDGSGSAGQCDQQLHFAKKPMRLRDQFAEVHSTALARSHS
jgi:hypothetical protein